MRLFFAAQVVAQWPDDYPAGRTIPDESRHITLAFLGNQSTNDVGSLLENVPLPMFKVGLSAISDHFIFLPPQHSQVAALSVKWLHDHNELHHYRDLLIKNLKQKGYAVDDSPFLPHVSIARAPFDKNLWAQHLSPLAFYTRNISLFQSLGNLQYKVIWKFDLLPPFEELEHTADIAFLIRGHSPQEIHANAQLALAFNFPQLIPFLNFTFAENLQEIVISLNKTVSIADQELGCPFKAVSFHGNIVDLTNGIKSWEMIVDV